MNPGVFVAGGGGNGGGKGGKGGKNGNGEEGAGTGEGDEDANGDGNNADACGEGTSECAGPHGGNGTTAGHPVDVGSGAVFTTPVVDLHLPGPLALTLTRQYNTKWRGRNVGLGFGWRHSLAYEVEVGRRRGTLHRPLGGPIEFKRKGLGETIDLGADRFLKEEAWGFRYTEGRLTFFFAPARNPRAFPVFRYF